MTLIVVQVVLLAVWLYVAYRSHRALKQTRASIDRLQAANTELKMLNEAYAFMLARMGVTYTIEQTANGVTVLGRASSPKVRPH